MPTVNGTSDNDFIHEPGDGHSADDVPTVPQIYIEYAGATPGPDQINGLNGNDLIFGGAQDTVNGGLGDDILIGSGTTRLAGGRGNDTYYYSAGDTIVELANEGSDAVKVNSPVSFSIEAMLGIERLILMPGGRNTNATGNTNDNWIVGNGGDNVIRGMGGFDILLGGSGDDTYVNPLGSIVGDSAGYDTIRSDQTFSIAASSAVERLVLTGSSDINGIGADLNETIVGQSGANILIGNEGDDTLSGGAGNDTIVGGAGDDVLSGGGNVDLFRFGASGEGQDTVTDLQFGNDLFDLSGNLFTGLTEASGNTTLSYAGGTILVEGITGKSLAQWNGRVISGGGANAGLGSSLEAQPEFGRSHDHHDAPLPHAQVEWLLT